MLPRRNTVLVVEDDLDCLEAMSDVLEYDGYEVVAATNGLEALQALEAEPTPDLILLDLMLPVMDGWQFLHEQRARPAVAHIPVALLSAERDLPRHAKQLRVAGYITKPVDLSDLLETVRKLAGPPRSDH